MPTALYMHVLIFKPSQLIQIKHRSSERGEPTELELYFLPRNFVVSELKLNES